MHTNETALRRHAARVHRGAQSSLALLDWLEAEGFSPMHITIEAERRPIVHVALSAKCAWLKSKHHAYMHTRTPSAIVWRCDLMGCRVQWTEGGH